MKGKSNVVQNEERKNVANFEGLHCDFFCDSFKDSKENFPLHLNCSGLKIAKTNFLIAK